MNIGSLCFILPSDHDHGHNLKETDTSSCKHRSCGIHELAAANSISPKCNQDTGTTLIEVCESSDDSSLHLKGLARGLLRHAWSHKGYFINGFKFHTEKYGEGRVTHNSGVFVKGACYNEAECDFYGLLEEVIEVAYRGVGRCVMTLFKSSQVEQVYYAPYPSMTKDLKDWWVGVKTKSKSMYELEECENEEDGDDNGDGEEFFQESET
ncbi:hypothetical protein Tco_1379659, partial [Tanacetum coccineum]